MVNSSLFVRVTDVLRRRLKLKKFTPQEWRHPANLALISYFLVTTVIGLSITNDILRTHAWARDFSDFIASIVPQIDRFTALGIKPDVNRFYFSVLWTTSPVLFGILLGSYYGRTHLLPGVTQRPLHKIAGNCLLCIFDIYVAWNHWPFDPTFRLTRSWFGSAIGRSFCGQLVLVAGPVFCSAVLAIIFLSYVARLNQLRRSKETHMPHV